MHILLIHQAFTLVSEPGGTRHHELALQLAARGHKITVVTSPVSYLTGLASQSVNNGDTEKQIRILRPSRRYGLQKTFIGRILSFADFMISSIWIGRKVRDVDVVWGTSPPLFQAISAWSLARLKRARFVLEVRDLWPSFAIALGVLKNPILIWLSRLLEGFLYRRADTVIVNSPGFLDHVSSRGAIDVRVVPNGVDMAMFVSDDNGEEFRKRNHLDGFFVVLYAGAHGISNDLGVLLEAANQLRQNEEIKIVMVGDGREKADLENRAAHLGIKNVHFLPAIPKLKMPSTLDGADLCVAILKPIDPFKLTYPNKVFDYMAAGKPVLLAIDGVIREVVEVAGAGVFVEPGDPKVLAESILEMSQNRSRLREMGEAGRKHVQSHFDRSAQTDNLLAAFEKIEN
jgi:glycosyltransferase involved in cell wall biosynthesis